MQMITPLLGASVVAGVSLGDAAQGTLAGAMLVAGSIITIAGIEIWGASYASGVLAIREGGTALLIGGGLLYLGGSWVSQGEWPDLWALWEKF